MTLVFEPGVGPLPRGATVYDAARCLDCQIAQGAVAAPWYQDLTRPDRAILHDAAHDLTLEVAIDGQDRITGLGLRAALRPGLPPGDAAIPRLATPARLVRWDDGGAAITAHRQGSSVVLRLGALPRHYLPLATGVWVGLDPDGVLCGLAFDPVQLG